MQSYEQPLRLFERWAREQEQIESPLEVREQTIRHYICELQERGKYSACAREESRENNCPERRRDYLDDGEIKKGRRNRTVFFSVKTAQAQRRRGDYSPFGIAIPARRAYNQAEGKPSIYNRKRS